MQDQSALAAANPSNPLLQYRGNAGTHDLELGSRTLQALKALRSPQQTAGVPRSVCVLKCVSMFTLLGPRGTSKRHSDLLHSV